MKTRQILGVALKNKALCAGSFLGRSAQGKDHLALAENDLKPQTMGNLER